MYTETTEYTVKYLYTFHLLFQFQQVGDRNSKFWANMADSIYLKIWNVSSWHCLLQTVNNLLYCSSFPRPGHATYIHTPGT
jgi:hypothetical protein